MKEFKEFALKGNVLDMAVGVIIGSAFGKIVTSLVNDVITPVIGLFMKQEFSSLKLVLREAIMEGETIIKEEVALKYGAFIQNVIDFLIIAISIFIFVKIANNIRKKFEKPVEEAPAAPAGPTDNELLTEIRDLLKNK